MFAYCGNNPVIFQDTTGTKHEMGAGIGGGGGSLAYAGPASGHIVRPTAPPAVPLVIPFIPPSTTYYIDSLRAETIAIRKRLNAQEEALAKAEALAISATKTASPQYFLAELIDGSVVPIIPLTYQDARLWATCGGNLLCVSHSAAIAIVKFFPSAKWDGRHGCPQSGYLNHYHLSSAHGNHIWYVGD